MNLSSWTARGALILTGCGACILAVGYTEAPPPFALVELSDLTLSAAGMRAAYIDRWQDRGIELVLALAAVWGIYGARNVVPVPAGWSRAPTSAELRASEPAPGDDADR